MSEGWITVPEVFWNQYLGIQKSMREQMDDLRAASRKA